MTQMTHALLQGAIEDLHEADAEQLASFVEQLLGDGPPPAVHHLTSGQREVLDALVQGLRRRAQASSQLKLAGTGWDGLD